MKKGFTLTELLIVITIMGLLITIATHQFSKKHKEMKAEENAIVEQYDDPKKHIGDY